MNSITARAAERSPPKLLTQVRERIRFHHYALSTEKAYVHWIRFFIRFHGLRHPNEMGVVEVEAFLSHLANERKVSASTHKQALSAILFLYKEVLRTELPWLQDIGRPRTAFTSPNGTPTCTMPNGPGFMPMKITRFLPLPNLRKYASCDAHA
jgi:hypothetical protein